MSIFQEVKEHLTARQAAEHYGLQIRRNGMACCPFHDDKHPSMKIDKNYHCFACGAGGDVVDYVSRMFGLSQYDAALKLIEDFGLPVVVGGERKSQLSAAEKERLRREKAEKERIIHIKKRFEKWCNRNIDVLKGGLSEIEKTGIFLKGKPPDMVLSDDYAQMLHDEPLIGYWLDILCMGEMQERQELFMKDRKKVETVAERIRECGERIVERNRGSDGCGNEQCGRCAG